jgi:CIC family chloride channel protein
MIFLSIIAGTAGGLGAVIIKNGVRLIDDVLTQGFSDEYSQVMFIFYPAIGLLASSLIIRYIIRNKVGHGIPNVLYAISKNNGIMRSFQMYASIITSSITVGFGGSVGLEGPTVSTGAAVGSNIGRFLRLDYKNITLLIACASTGAVAAIFKAPITAIVFALEVLMLDLTMASILPLLIASVSGAVTSYFFLGQKVIYPFEVVDPFLLSDIPLYLALGIFCGFISLYFTKMYLFIAHKFERINRWYFRYLIGAGILGLLIFLLPSLYGEGYDAINSSLHANFDHLFRNTFYYRFNDNSTAIIITLMAIILLKGVATSVTFGGGGIGGIFAPSLFTGAHAGLLFSYFINDIIGNNLSKTNFALVGMGGVIAGILHAPLTGMFLIAEITGGYQLFLPLMIVATLSYATINAFEKTSVYTYQLAKRGELFTHDKDKVVLSLMNVNDLLETKFKTIDENATLGDLVKIIQKSKRNIFPVINDENHLLGIIHLNNVRHVIFKPELYDTTKVNTLMYFPVNFVSPDDSMEEIVQKFQSSGHFNLPVLKEGKYIGFVSRANVLSKYRKLLKHFSED